MKRELEKIVFKKSEIKKRVKEIGQAISRDYQGKDLVMIGVLRGAAFFLTDLALTLSINPTIDFISISRYTPGSKGVVRLTKDLEETIEGRHALIVEDIVDTGLTISYLCRTLQARNPASLEICTMLNRSVRRIADIPLKYVGFDLPDVFVVGYGLDYRERFRNLPYLAIPKEAIFQEA